MFKLEEKFKNYYGKDYFPYYVGTLAAMIHIIIMIYFAILASLKTL